MCPEQSAVQTADIRLLIRTSGQSYCHFVEFVVDATAEEEVIAPNPESGYRQDVRVLNKGRSHADAPTLYSKGQLIHVVYLNKQESTIMH